MRIGQRLVATVALTLLLAPTPRASAEPPRGPGTFQGVYHMDRWGRGQVAGLRVDPALHKRFAPFEGKRIQLEVTSTRQISNPGTEHLLAVGSIEEITEGPSFQFDVAKAHAGAPNEWLVTVTNVGDSAATLVMNYLSLGYFRLAKLAGTGNSPATPQFRRATRAWGTHSPNGAGLVEIPPNESYAVAYHVALDRTDGEFAVSYRHNIGRTSVRCPYAVWRRADEPMASMPASQFVIEDPTVTPWHKHLPQGGTPYDGAYLLTGSLRPGSDGARLPIFAYEGVRCASHRIRAFDKSDREVRVHTITVCDDGTSTRGRYHWAAAPHRVSPLLTTGLPLRVFFWVHSRFAEEPIARITLEVLAANGIARVPVPEPLFRDIFFTAPPSFGSSHQGVRLRVRAIPGREGATEFLVEATNDTDHPINVVSPAMPQTEVMLLVDGKTVPIYLRHPMVFGWAAKHTCKERMELLLQPEPRLTLAPGSYTAQVIFRGRGGTYPNASNDPIPVLKGEVRTPKTTIVVR